MSEYDELVKILRDGGWRGAEAADAIEALVGDVETAKSQFKALQMVTSKEHEARGRAHGFAMTRQYKGEVMATVKVAPNWVWQLLEWWRGK